MKQIKMKVEIDTEKKEIVIMETVTVEELVDYLKGYEGYSVTAFQPIEYTQPINPYYPTHPYYLDEWYIMTTS